MNKKNYIIVYLIDNVTYKKRKYNIEKIINIQKVKTNYYPI